jgi:4-amino-4-deoxy-L-arabinose transferase-like glycosyltransferase
MPRKELRLLPFFGFAIVIYGAYLSLSSTFGYDTVTRALMGARWLDKPFYIYAGNPITWSFGPLNCYINALAIYLSNNPDLGPRLCSAIFGLLTILPLFGIAREIFGRKAALYSAVAFPFFSLYINLSVSGNSESLSGFLFLSSVFFAVRFSSTLRLSYVLLSGLAMALASATRYEIWLFIPAIALFLFRNYIFDKNRRRLIGCFYFLFLATIFPLSWAIGNYVQYGNYLAFIPREDRDPVQIIHGSNLLFDFLYRLAYLPAVLFLSLSPPVFLISTRALISSIKNKSARFVLWLTAIYIVYYLMAFVIMRTSILAARHLNLLGLFLLIFFGAGFIRLQKRVQPAKRVFLYIAILICMIVAHAALLPFNRPAQGWAERLRSISPIVRAAPYIDLTVANFETLADSGYTIFLDAKQYEQRALYLRLHKYWSNISAYYGTADGFISAAIKADPDILALSFANRRLKNIAMPNRDIFYLRWPDKRYQRIERIGPFHLYRRCGLSESICLAKNWE